MAICPECEFEIDVDEYDVDRGDTLECDNCGVTLEIIGLNPIEFEVAPDDEDEDEEMRRRSRRGRGRGRRGRGRVIATAVPATDGRADEGRLTREGGAPAAALAGLELGHRGVQRRHRQRLPRVGGHRRCSATRRSASRPTAPATRPGTAQLAERLARDFSLHHEFIVTGEMEQPEYRANEPDRCYYCKQELFTQLTALARRARASRPSSTAPTRTTAATTGPGARPPASWACAARSTTPICPRPRSASSRGAPGCRRWDEPASACLSSRIPYHSEVTPEKLAMIERAEDVLIAPRVPRSAASAITATWPASSSGPTRWPARSSPRCATPSSATSRPSATATSRSTSRATGWAASTKASACSRSEARRDRPASRRSARGSRAWWARGCAGARLPARPPAVSGVDARRRRLGELRPRPARLRSAAATARTRPGTRSTWRSARRRTSSLSEPRALAIWGALFGALSAFALLRLFAGLDALDGDDRRGSSRRGHRSGSGEWLGRPAVATALTHGGAALLDDRVAADERHGGPRRRRWPPRRSSLTAMVRQRRPAAARARRVADVGGGGPVGPRSSCSARSCRPSRSASGRRPRG